MVFENKPLSTNILQYSKDFTYFNDFFDNTFYKQGIIKSHNLSLYISILFCINKDYFILSEEEILYETTQFKNKYNNIQSIVNNLKLNIIIFNFDNHIIKTIYNNEFFNPFISTLLLSYKNNYYEPIICNDTKIFSYSSPKINIFKNNILTSDIQYYDNSKEFILNDNIFEILELENITNINNIDNTFITHREIKNNLSQSKLNKMKKDKLLNICNELNIIITNKRIIKKEIINLILNN
jgi:hypothetical protein